MLDLREMTFCQISCTQSSPATAHVNCANRYPPCGLILNPFIQKEFKLAALFLGQTMTQMQNIQCCQSYPQSLNIQFNQ